MSIFHSVNWVTAKERILPFDKAGVAYGFIGKYQGDYAQEFHSVKQVHGCDIVQAGQRVAADGLFVLVPAGDGGRALAVVTADCLPILLVDKKKRMLMAIHAGWRGLTQGIVSAGTKIFTRYNIKSEDLIVTIGPHVSAKHYEVGRDVMNAVAGLPSVKDWKSCFENLHEERGHLHLARVAILELVSCGVSAGNIHVVTDCTFANPLQWASYRRDGVNCGHNVSWIGRGHS